MAEQARLTCDLENVRLRIAAAEQSIGRIREEAAVLEQQKGQAVTAIEVERGRLGHYEQQRAQALGELERLAAEREQVTAAIAELWERLTQSGVEIATQTRTLSELEEAEKGLAARRAAAAEEVERARRTSLDATIRATSEENLLVSLGNRREETKRRAERLAGEGAEIESQCATALGRLQEAARRREGSEQQLREQQGDREQLVQETHRLEERLYETDQLVGRKQEELAIVESRLRALQEVTREEMGYGREGAEETTSLRAACSGVREAVAEWLVVSPGLERAIEAILGERMRAWLVESPATAREAIEFLKQKGLGRGAFVPVRPRWSSQSGPGRCDRWWPALQVEAGVVGKALDLVRASGEAQDALGCLLGAVVIVESLEVAIDLWDRGLWSGPDGPTLVTLTARIAATSARTLGFANPGV
jgi:chromosome segregation protein